MRDEISRSKHQRERLDALLRQRREQDGLMAALEHIATPKAQRVPERAPQGLRA